MPPWVTNFHLSPLSRSTPWVWYAPVRWGSALNPAPENSGSAGAWVSVAPVATEVTPSGVGAVSAGAMGLVTTVPGGEDSMTGSGVDALATSSWDPTATGNEVAGGEGVILGLEHPTSKNTAVARSMAAMVGVFIKVSLGGIRRQSRTRIHRTPSPRGEIGIPAAASGRWTKPEPVARERWLPLP